jgi:hypothetical protein
LKTPHLTVGGFRILALFDFLLGNVGARFWWANLSIVLVV